MHFRVFLAASAASISLACTLAAPAAAQETTAAIRGEVTNAGAAVTGATVTIEHVPTGAVTTVTTGSDGTFSAAGLRPGGPFTVKVSGGNAPEATVTDVYTSVGQTFALPIDLSSAELAGGGNEIVVTATRIRGAGNLSAGPVNVVTADQISKIASVNRDIRDLAARNPFATLDTSQSTGRQVSFAGQNPRFNRFTVDGVPITDSFGLNPDALPSRRGPVPLDSIGQFETKVAPYDIREGFFQGGVSNAILRSGTNKFQGTAFYTYSADELTGKKTAPYITNLTGVIPQPNFTSRDFGAEISGPIIKDKLFFMIAAERVRAASPVPYGTVDDNGGIPVTNLTSATLSQIQQIAQSKYNYAAGGIVRTNGDKDDRIVGKLDANLSDTQRVSLTGLYTKDSIIALTNTGSATLSTESNAYLKPNKMKAGVLSWNADWSDKFSTEARALYKTYDSGQFPLFGRSAQFTICAQQNADALTASTGTSTQTVCPVGTPQVVLGAGGPSQTNELRIRTWGGSLSARLKAGDHSFRLLGEWNHTQSFNAFVNPSAGAYYFDSIQSLSNGVAQSYSYNNAPSLNPADAAVNFAYDGFTFGAQDDWRVGDMLTVNAGVRYDVFGTAWHPALNPNFLRRYGFPNNYSIEGIGLVQPRFGFTFKPDDRLVLRGGAGIFGGGSPDVYIGNAYSNTGVINTTITARTLDNGAVQLNSQGGAANVASATAILGAPSFTNVPSAANAAIQAAAAGLTSNPDSTTSINAVDPNLRMPNQFRATLSADYKADLGPLGDGWRFGADVLYSKVRSQVIVTDLRSVPVYYNPSATAPTSIVQLPGYSRSLTPDGRPRYAGALTTNPTDSGQDLLLTNTSYGWGLIGVLRFEKTWDSGLTIGGAYTRQDVRDASALTSSQAGSIYGNTATFDPNFGSPGHSNDEVVWAFRYNVSYEHAFFGDYRTRIDLFGTTRAGARFSYTMQEANGRGLAGNTFGTAGTNTRYLFYVPTGTSDPLVNYDSTATRDRIDTIINSSGLANYRGKIAPRNGFRNKAFTRIDLHAEQELPLPLGAKFSLFADIENFTNLINHNWGQQLRTNFPYRKQVARVACQAVGANPCGTYLYSSPSSDAVLADELVTTNGSSLYSIRIGARISF